jgi:SAM-dependent methyltransferase
MLNWIMRYQPVIKLLDELGAEKVLDVGSGWYGLSWYWPRSVVQTDLYFTGDAPSPVERAGTAEFVPATAEALPFADKSFDYAVSLDMMEHLPADIRGKAVAELARVSRMGFVIGYPVGDAAARLDRRLAKMWSVTPGAAVPDWLEEHLAQAAYPDRDTLVAALPPGWRIAREIPSGNTVLQTAVVYGETLRGLRRLAGLAERRARRQPLPKFLDRGKTYRTVWLVLPDQVATGEAAEGSIDWGSIPEHPDGSELEAALALARTKKT